MRAARLLLPLTIIVAGCSSGSGHSSSVASSGATGAIETRDAALSGGGGATGAGATTSGGQGGSLTTSTGRSGLAGSTGPDSSTGAGGGGGSSGASSSTGKISTGGTTSADAGVPDARSDGPRDSVSEAARPDGRDSRDTPVSDGSSCPHTGHVTYTLARNANPTAAESKAYGLITTAMDKAIAYYNCYTDITKALNVSYNSSVETADGNINGSIRFGGTSYMEYVTAMHEIGHTVGVGTASNWRSFIAFRDGGSSGPWKGASATAELRTLTGQATDTLTADTQHFWPYGLNYASEAKSEADLIGHCRIVVALRKDMGL